MAQPPFSNPGEIVLRSGYVVDVAASMRDTIDHLKNAIVMENMTKLTEQGGWSREMMAREIAAEITYLATTIPPTVLQSIFRELLSDAAVERLLYIEERARRKLAEPPEPEAIH